MDITQSIFYRGLDINGVVLQTGRVLRGITVEQVDYSNIDAVGYTEKRAAADGIHASDIYLGARLIEISGLIYAPTLAEMFDYLHSVRAVFSPTSAYTESPGDRGFLPLSYVQQTTDLVSFPAVTGPPAYPAGTVPLFINARPRVPPRFLVNRDRQTDSKIRPASMPWSASLIAKDPRVYIRPEKIVDLAGAPSGTQVNGVAINRGDYETPLDIQLVIGATVPIAGAEFRVKGFNALDMKIKVEAKANVIYRWFGDDRVLMTEDVSAGVGTAPLVLRQDLVTFLTKQRRPLVPASIDPPSKPFSTPYAYWRTNLTLAANSRMFWSEAFA